MAEVIGSVALSHGPQLMVKPEDWGLLHNRLGKDRPVRADLAAHTLADKQAMFDRCMTAIGALRAKVEAWKPDVLVLLGDDQGENITNTVNPPFTVYIGGDFEASVSLSYYGQPNSENRTKYRADQKLSEDLLARLMDQGFDPAWSRELCHDGGMGHAFARVLKFLTPAANIPVVCVMINTYFPPAPSARRCVAFGTALRMAIEAVPGARRVGLVASGGLSHTIIDEVLDNKVLDALKARDFETISAIPSSVLTTGTSEIRNWFIVGAASSGPATVVDYVPAYRMPNGVGCAMGFAYWNGK